MALPVICAARATRHSEKLGGQTLSQDPVNPNPGTQVLHHRVRWSCTQRAGMALSLEPTSNCHPVCKIGQHCMLNRPTQEQDQTASYGFDVHHCCSANLLSSWSSSVHDRFTAEPFIA